MKKAVIATGGKQYLVSENDTIEVESLHQEGKIVSFVPLLVIEGDKTSIGTPELSSKVSAEIIEPMVKAEKVTAIRYKPKKRVHKVRGHRQQHTVIKITKIT